MTNTTHRGTSRQARFWKGLVCFADIFLLIASRFATRPKVYVTVCLLLCGIRLWAQTPVKRIPIDIISSEHEGRISLNGHTGREYTKSVKIRHGDLIMSCDWAFYNDSTNQLTASGHVQLTLDESTAVKADTMHYQGDQQQALLRGQVTFQHYGLVLTTSQFDYSQRTGIIHYADKPRIVGEQYLLTIREGHYDSKNRQFATRPEVPPIVLSLSKAPAALTQPDSVNTSRVPVTEVKPAAKSAETAPLSAPDTSYRAPVRDAPRPVTAKPAAVFTPKTTVRPTNTPMVPAIMKKPASSTRPVSVSNKPQPQTETPGTPTPKTNPETTESELERLLNPRKEPR